MDRQTVWGAWFNGRCALEMPVAADRGTPVPECRDGPAPYRRAPHSKSTVIVRTPFGAACTVIWLSHIPMKAGW